MSPLIQPSKRGTHLTPDPRARVCEDDDDSQVLLQRSSSLCRRQSRPSHRNIMGKVEGQGESWHGHVTAVTVAPEYRRQQLAKKLMNLLEDISDNIDKAFFVDLFVRASNAPAIKMYEKLGYVIYRRVLRYYSGEEDGLDMRKALSRDVEKKSIIPLKRPVTPDELEYD
uniref:N-acetyltransferase domain-containing protein n=1 Tax=Glycine max TaxID=3847 RepID=A0A368UIE5_SOYBN